MANDESTTNDQWLMTGDIRAQCLSHPSDFVIASSFGLHHSSFSARCTSTRVSKNVAPPPRSVNRVLVVVLQLTPSRVYLFHQIPWVTTAPALTVSPTTA